MMAMIDYSQNDTSRHTVGNRLLWSILSLFFAFAVMFIIFQQMREREYKIGTINLKLQEYNIQMESSLFLEGKIDEKIIDRYVKTHRMPNMRVTMIDTKGRVFYDNKRKDYDNFQDHSSREEIKDALSKGTGYDINRISNTVDGDYFYSATYFAREGYIIRSALPYNNDLTQSLQADQHYIWFALFMVVILTMILLRFVKRLDKNINKLRIFAKRADHNESLDTEDLVDFPADELGEISEYIIKIYKRLQKTKEEQNVLKRQLTQNISHELKTPVASIQGYLETILNNENMNDETREMFLKRCYAQSQRLSSLLGDISTLNRMDDAPEMMPFEEIDITKMIEQIEKETSLSMSQHHMTLSLHIPKTMNVRGNTSLMYSIFRNLIDNAIAYAGENTQLTIEANEDDNEDKQYHFAIYDNGVGVAHEHLSRLFERFYRVDKGRSRKVGGTGLGLAIVKNAVNLHGGKIIATENNGSGLRFDFTIKKNK